MNFVAGLYNKEEQVLAALKALKEAGFREKECTILARKPIEPPDFERRASTGDVVRKAAISALVLGLVGAIFALMVGAGVIPIGGLFPNYEPGQIAATLKLTIFIALISAVAGAILGAAFQLRAAPDQAKITSKGVIHPGLLLVLSVAKNKIEKACNVLEENDAVDVEVLDGKWDTQVWSRYRGVEMPSGN